MVFRRRKPNLLLLGASGGVSNAFLHHLPTFRHLFEKLILLDKVDTVLHDQYVDHKYLDYFFVHKKIDLETERKSYIKFLKEYKIDVVLDLTDVDSIPLLEATNEAGVSYVNTALNSETNTVTQLVKNIYPRKEKINNATHILCTGMNPGVVNIWVAYGTKKHGKPEEIVHFEYDTSTPSEKWENMMTWSIKEFLVEDIRDPSGIALGRDRVKELHPNALMNRVPLKNILSPVLKLGEYPSGMQVLHEENLTVANKYNVPSQFVYAVNIKTMDNLTKIYKEKGDVSRSDFILGDNTNTALEGSDSIGVILRYKKHDVYYFNSAPNSAAVGTNGTYTQVIVGVYAALFTLMYDRPKPKTYFVEDLIDTSYKNFVFDNMRVSEYVFGEDKKIKHFEPKISLRPHKKLRHLYVL